MTFGMSRNSTSLSSDCHIFAKDPDADVADVVEDEEKLGTFKNLLEAPSSNSLFVPVELSRFLNKASLYDFTSVKNPEFRVGAGYGSLCKLDNKRWRFVPIK